MAEHRSAIRRRLAAAVAAAVGLTACAGAGGSTVALTPTPPGTESPVIGSYRTTTPLAPVVTAPQASAFCQDVAQLQGVVPTLLVPNGPAAALNQARAIINRLPKDAPADIAPAASALAQAVNRIVADLRSSPPNLTDLGPVIVGYEAAVQQLADYARRHC